MTATQTWTAFMKAWQERDWREVFNLCQKTAQKNLPYHSMAAMLEPYIITSYRKTEAIKKSNVCVDIKAVVVLKTPEGKKKYTVTARVVRERGPYNPDSKGKWGVNPISMVAFKEVQNG